MELKLLSLATHEFSIQKTLRRKWHPYYFHDLAEQFFLFVFQVIETHAQKHTILSHLCYKWETNTCLLALDSLMQYSSTTDTQLTEASGTILRLINL